MLTDADCRGAKAGTTPYKLYDSGGLFLFVTAAGHRSWRFKYRFAGKERQRVLGAYPEVSLRAARELRDQNRKLLREGLDPSIEAQRARLSAEAANANTFEIIAREWHGKQQKRWKPVHAADVITSLERDIFPWLGKLPLTAIDAAMVLAVLQKVERRGAIETAHRLRQRISAVFVYAIASHRASADPAASLTAALEAKPAGKRWPAALDIPTARKVLSTTDSAHVTPTVKLASRLLAITAQRPGMIRWLRWDELHNIDLTGEGDCPDAIWRVPAGKMKQELKLRSDQAFAHSVPLPGAAVAVLRAAFILNGDSEYVFPGGHSGTKPMSENALSYLYLREGMRGRHVPHGWRASFSTIMNEWAEEHGRETDRLVLDLMLAHLPVGLSDSELKYNRAAFMRRRRQLAGIWADMLLNGLCAAVALLEGRRRRIT